MIPIINRRSLLMMCLLMFASSQLLLSAKKNDIKLRPWNDGPLTWADYKKADFGNRADYSSILEYAFTTDNNKVRIGNYKFVYYSVNSSLVSNHTFYDPLSATDWDLRSDQVVFDIMELHSRYAQNRGLGETTQHFYKIKDGYLEQAQKEIDKFNKESNQGRDTSVVRKYEESIKAELERTPRKEPDLSMGGRVPGMIGMYLAFNGCAFLGSTSSDLKNAGGLNLGLDFLGKKGWYYDAGFSGIFSSVKTPDYYIDPTYNYNWVAGKSTNLTRFYLNVGHTLKSNQYYRLTPYAGIGFSMLGQQSDTYNEQSDSFYTSDITGLLVQAGINADWIFRFTFRPDEVVENSLRFKLFGAYDRLGGKNVWSVNVGLAFHFDVQTYNTAMVIPIPIIF